MKKLIGLLIFVFALESCETKTEKQVTVKVQDTESKQEPMVSDSKNDTQQQNDQNSDPKNYLHLAQKYLNQLKKGEKLHLFFKDNWTFVYHKDNRCDGSTDGEKTNLSPLAIDEIIKIKVKNDGDGWACDKKEPSEFYLYFKLNEQIKSWDRFEIPNYENQGKDGIIYLIGGGESDYLVLHYDINNLIDKMEYRSEDPG